MGATRIVLAMLLVALAQPARAESVDLVVFGPVTDGSNPKANAAVSDVLAKSKLGVSSPRVLEVACAASTDCLVKAGAEASGRRALAVVVAGGKIGLVLVDVLDKDLISKRDLAIADKKIAKDLGKELRKFLDDGPTDRAKALFAEGNKHYELGEYPPALDKYKKAYRVKALPAFQFNIAQCHRKLGQYTEAIQMYQAYLVGVPNADNKTLVDSLITESKNQIAAADKAKRDAEQAKLDTEKKKAEDARKQKEAEAAAKQAIANAEAEKRRQLQVKLDAEHQKELDKTYNKHPARKFMVITGLAGLATAGVGGYFAYRVRSKQSDFNDALCGDGAGQLSPGDALAACQDAIDQGKKDARLANILIGTGGGVFLASLIVYIIDPGNLERPKERPMVTITPSSVNMVVHW